MLYAGRMTSVDQAVRELQDAINGIMVVSFPSATVIPCPDADSVEVHLWPEEAIELADWIRSRTQASADNPAQAQFSFSTE